jgi:hypothetical protein
MRLTAGGFQLVKDVPDAPTGPRAIAQWRRDMSPSQLKIFDELVSVAPKTLTPDELSQRTGIDRGVSTFRVAVNKLKQLGIVTGTGNLRLDESLW